MLFHTYEQATASAKERAVAVGRMMKVIREGQQWRVVDPQEKVTREPGSAPQARKTGVKEVTPADQERPNSIRTSRDAVTSNPVSTKQRRTPRTWNEVLRPRHPDPSEEELKERERKCADQAAKLRREEQKAEELIKAKLAHQNSGKGEELQADPGTIESLRDSKPYWQNDAADEWREQL